MGDKHAACAWGTSTPRAHAQVRHSLASFKDWKSELAFVTATVPEVDCQVHEDMLQAKTDVIAVKGVLRFIQLLCEGHHLQLQNYLREQPGATASVNIVTEVMRFLKEVCPRGPGRGRAFEGARRAGPCVRPCRCSW